MARRADAPDADLARAAGAGDRDALETLLARHLDRLHVVCRRICGPDDALDATQDALVAIARSIGRFDGRAAFTTSVARLGAFIGAAWREAREDLRRLHIELPELGRVLTVEERHRTVLAAAKEKGRAAMEAAKAAKKPEPVAQREMRQAAGNASDQLVAGVTVWQEIGGLAGRFALAMLAVVIVSRRTLLRVFQLPALLFVPLFFWWMSGQLADPGSLTWIKAGIFIAGFLTVAQFSFWGNYIPLVFPVHLRGTGESFAANIGGASSAPPPPGSRSRSPRPRFPTPDASP